MAKFIIQITYNEINYNELILSNNEFQWIPPALPLMA